MFFVDDANADAKMQNVGRNLASAYASEVARLEKSLLRAIRRNRAHSATTPTHTHAATQQGVATHT